jgi:hypothetical protein
VERRIPPRCRGTLTASRSRKRQLDLFDRDLLAFLLSWAPYGGPPDSECFVEFGMSAARLRERCVQVVSTTRSIDCNDEERELLLRTCRLLLAHQIQRGSRSSASLNNPKVNRFVRRAALARTFRPGETAPSATSSPTRILPPLSTQQ